MKKSVVIIVNAIIWGLVIVGCSLALKGTGAYKEIQLILAGGAVASLIVVSAGSLKKPKE